jgi:hypothetical protein
VGLWEVRLVCLPYVSLCLLQVWYCRQSVRCVRFVETVLGAWEPAVLYWRMRVGLNCTMLERQIREWPRCILNHSPFKIERTLMKAQNDNRQCHKKFIFKNSILRIQLVITWKFIIEIFCLLRDLIFNVQKTLIFMKRLFIKIPLHLHTKKTLSLNHLFQMKISHLCTSCLVFRLEKIGFYKEFDHQRTLPLWLRLYFSLMENFVINFIRYYFIIFCFYF